MQHNSDDFIAPACHEHIQILYQDEHLLLIKKPSKLLSLSGKNPLNIDSVHYRLVKDFPNARLTHRLDFGTSGIMLISLSKSVNAHIGKQFQARSIKKSYCAILEGTLEKDEGTISFPIAKDVANFPFQKICYETGKEAITKFQVIERYLNPDLTKVTFTPLTGRTHQLRIHSREILHPIIGCDLYATERSKAMADRLMLHATTLEFVHPISGKQIKGLCPSPF